MWSLRYLDEILSSFPGLLLLRVLLLTLLFSRVLTILPQVSFRNLILRSSRTLLVLISIDLESVLARES